ncbi:unnamed protein product [Closterium sp. NIES-54]
MAGFAFRFETSQKEVLGRFETSQKELSSAVDTSLLHPRLPPPPRSLPTHLGRVHAPLIMSSSHTPNSTPARILNHIFLHVRSTFVMFCLPRCHAQPHPPAHNVPPYCIFSTCMLSHPPINLPPCTPPINLPPCTPSYLETTFLSCLLPSPAYLHPIARDATDVWVWHMHAEAENTFQYPANAWTLPQPNPQRLVRVAQEGSGWAYMVEGQRYGFEEKEPWPRFGYRAGLMPGNGTAAPPPVKRTPKDQFSWKD